MRTPLTLALVVSLLVAFAPPVQGQSAQDEAAVRKATEQLASAWNAQDVKAILAAIDEDCGDFWSGSPCYDEMRQSGVFPEAYRKSRIKILEHAGVVLITPDVAIHRFTTETSGFLDADGKPMPAGGSQQTTVFVRRGGKWLRATSFWRAIEAVSGRDEGAGG